jgi:hypothetical protein
MTKDWIIAALERSLEREGTEAAAVRDEIKQRGTWWAGSEIARLRRAVAALRKALEASGDD